MFVDVGHQQSPGVYRISPMKRVQKMIEFHRKNPWKGSGELAEALDKAIDGLQLIVHAIDPKDKGAIAAKALREVELLFGEPKH